MNAALCRIDRPCVAGTSQPSKQRPGQGYEASFDSLSTPSQAVNEAPAASPPTLPPVTLTPASFVTKDGEPPVRVTSSPE